MSSYEMLSRAAIQAWLKSLVQRTKEKRDGPTLHCLGKYLGIPKDSLAFLSRADVGMSKDRQRLLSKVIAQIENGQLTFERVATRKGLEKRAVFVDNPKPRVRYGVDFKAGGPRLRFIDRPKPYKPMPSFKNVLLT